MGDNVIVTTSNEIRKIVVEAVEVAVKRIKDKNFIDEYVDQNEARQILKIKDKRTLEKKVQKFGVTTYSIDNKKVYKREDIKRIINPSV